MQFTVQQIGCNDEQCDVVTIYRLYADGSFEQMTPTCCHWKDLPDRTKILELIAKENNIGRQSA